MQANKERQFKIQPYKAFSHRMFYSVTPNVGEPAALLNGTVVFQFLHEISNLFV
jgi:hypothetical protein